jgi:hypothetical protein
MRPILIILALTLSGCGDDQPPAPTPEQADQLNAAEDMLNQEAANEKGPEDRSPGPNSATD